MQTHQTRGLVKGFVTKRLCLKREPSTQYPLAFVQGYQVRERERRGKVQFQNRKPKSLPGKWGSTAAASLPTSHQL